MKLWRLPQIDADAVSALAEAAGLDEFCSRILLARGVSSPEDAAQFLHGGALHDPMLMRDMDRAVAAIESTMMEEKLIVVYGDYDCDGITATSLLYRYLEERGAQVAYYIPDREEEGYGLNRGACDAMCRSGASLVITVDNGVTAIDEIAYLYEHGVRVVVTDHHQPREELPVCEAVLNPHRADDGYPFKDLAGVGVAFKLVCALEGDDVGLDTLERYADLVCIGTIADVVSLRGENRTIATAGLRILAQSGNPGVRALMQAAGLAAERLTAESVSFGLAPRLNAASRLGICDKSVELMLCDEEDEASRLAAEVDACNARRRSLENDIAHEIAAQIEQDPSLVRGRVIVLAGENWHHGVIGIVAARILQRYGKPTLLLSVQGEEARGSARSVEGFSIIDALHACAPILQKYGGHTLAAGVTLAAQDVPALRAMLEAEAARLCPDMPHPPISIDAELFPAQVTLAQAERLSQLEPFGAGNEQPVFLLRGVKIDELTAIGNGKHLRARLSAAGRTLQAVGFGMTPETFPVPAGEYADLCATLSINEYAGSRRPSLRLLDAHPVGFDQEEYLRGLHAYERFCRNEDISPQEAAALTPGRDLLALIWRSIRAAEAGVGADPDVLACRLKISPVRTRVAIDVLLEAGLLSRGEERLRIVPTSGKVDLEQTDILCSLRKAAEKG